MISSRLRAESEIVSTPILSHTCITASSLSWSTVGRHSSRLFSFQVIAPTATCDISWLRILNDSARSRDVNLNNQIDFWVSMLMQIDLASGFPPLPSLKCKIHTEITYYRHEARPRVFVLIAALNFFKISVSQEKPHEFIRSIFYLSLGVSGCISTKLIRIRTLRKYADDAPVTLSLHWHIHI